MSLISQYSQIRDPLKWVDPGLAVVEAGSKQGISLHSLANSQLGMAFGIIDPSYRMIMVA